jgi:hypothetical protein
MSSIKVKMCYFTSPFLGDPSWYSLSHAVGIRSKGSRTTYLRGTWLKYQTVTLAYLRTPVHTTRTIAPRSFDRCPTQWRSFDIRIVSAICVITNCLNGGADCSRNATPYFWWDPIGIQALLCFDHSATAAKLMQF